MKILLTFTGFHDPYFKGLLDQEEQPGPIISLLKNRLFNKIYLFDTPNTKDITSNTKEEIQKLIPDIEVDIKSTPLSDPTNYEDILFGLKAHLEEIQNKEVKAEFFIAVASGTPQMHASWLLLSASGVIPANIIHIRPPKFVTKDHPIISEIDLNFIDFPDVRLRSPGVRRTDETEADPNIVLQGLGIVGDHPSMQKVFEIGALLAPSTVPILIQGETGTGKELIAKYIHQMSGRVDKPFIPVNCAAIPTELAESVLFGHKQGAFTGAIRDQIGKFDSADNGSLFLDELGELSLIAQSKLLRVLQDGIIEPLGSSKSHKVNVRIICATNRSLKKLINRGEFREDLYYRLNVGELKLPSLRERRSDIPKIALFILDKINLSLRNPRRFSTKALARLQSHKWHGNVRDLENVIERSVRLSRNLTIDADDLIITEPVTYADPLEALPEPNEGFELDMFIKSVRKQLILRAIEKAGGNKSKAASMLGISPQAVHKFVNQLESNSST
jgi:DNA-binding NtrC family response regulator